MSQQFIWVRIRILMNNSFDTSSIINNNETKYIYLVHFSISIILLFKYIKGVLCVRCSHKKIPNVSTYSVRDGLSKQSLTGFQFGFVYFRWNISIFCSKQPHVWCVMCASAWPWTRFIKAYLFTYIKFFLIVLEFGNITYGHTLNRSDSFQILLYCFIFVSTKKLDGRWCWQ